MSFYEDSSIIITPNAYKAGTLYAVVPTSGAADMDFTRATTATRVDEDGLVADVLSGVPRIDYTGGGCPHILSEPQRTNLFPYSEDFSQWSAISNITISPDSTISPDGTLNASKVLEQVPSATGHMVFDNLGLTPSVEYNFSIFVKKLNRRYVALQNSYNAANGSIAFFDLDTETLIYTYSTGTVGTFTVSDAKIENYNNGWYRLSANFQSNASTGVLPTLVLADSQWSTGFSYNNLYTGDVTKGAYIWGAQIEVGSYATSYIPTSGASVTRNQDQFTRDGIGGLINSTEGVWFAEIAALANDGTYREISLNDGTINNVLEIRYTPTDNQLQFIVRNAGSPVVIETITLSNALDFNKIAFSYKSNDYKMYVNGSEVGTDTSGTMPSGLDTLSLNWGSNYFFGKVKQLQVYTTALSDSDLTILTTP